MHTLELTAGIIIDAFLALLAGTLIFLIWRGKISLAKLLSEPTGDASLSRLQFLIFTFVIALSFFLVVLSQKDGPAFPVIPAGVYALLGISASSYLVSKGIQFSNPAGVARPALTMTPALLGPPAPGAALPVTVFSVTIVNSQPGASSPSLTWSLDAPSFGTIVQQSNGAQYTPAAGVPAGTTVTIRAQAAGYDDGTAVVTY
jgi:hypothetical protein